MLILVTGLTGSGKTTYCNNYKNQNKAKAYSIDQWMKSLYWQDMPENPNMKWFLENQEWYTDRITRCEDLIKHEVTELFGTGVDILLDLGFTSIKHRMAYVELAKIYSETVEIHHLDVDSEIRWKRVQNRNKEKSDTYTMEVTKEMFDYIEDIFEVFTAKEKEILKLPNSTHIKKWRRR